MSPGRGEPPGLPVPDPVRRVAEAGGGEPHAASSPRTCGLCRSRVDDEDLFCVTCGREVPPLLGSAPEERFTVHRFDCAGCGADLVWTIEAQGLACSFCGRRELVDRGEARPLRPSLLAPFRVGREAVLEDLRGRWRTGILRPARLEQEVTLDQVRGVFLPYWRYCLVADTHWTADSNATRPGADADWAPSAGRIFAGYDDLYVPTTGVLTPSEVAVVLPARPEVLVPFTESGLGSMPMETARLPRARAREAARGLLDRWLAHHAGQEVPGSRHRNLRTNPLITDATSELVAIPVWIVTYTHRGRRFRWVASGSSGQGVGELPVSYHRIVWILVILGALLMLSFVLSILAGMAG